MLRIQPDPERARSLLRLSKLRMRRIRTFSEHTESALLLESHYEIVKELATALLFLQGKKTLSHKELMHDVWLTGAINYSQYELLDRVRQHRNRIMYEGASIDPSFLIRNKASLTDATTRLQTRVELLLRTKR